MLTYVNDDQRRRIFQAIEGGPAVRIDAECFVDGIEDEYRVEFYRVPFGAEVVRTCYNRRTTCTEMNWVEGFARWEFDDRERYRAAVVRNQCGYGAGI